MTLKARIFSWGVRALYVGPAFNVRAHRTGVAVLCCGIGGEMQVARDPRDPAGWLACRTVLIRAGQVHLIRFNAEPIACLYLDPQSEDVERIATAMCRKDGAIAMDHARERELLHLLASVANDCDPARLGMCIAGLCGLAQCRGRNSVIDRVIARMRARPGDSHTLVAVARDVGLSESRLRHLFKTCTGVPFRRYRIWNRLGAGIATAAAGLPLTEAAHRAGFSSSAHFSSAFRAMFGLAPSDLIRARLELIAEPSHDKT